MHDETTFRLAIREIGRLANSQNPKGLALVQALT
jgi:hypothetical protein